MEVFFSLHVHFYFPNLKSQIATSSWGGRRKAPYAFTEQGIYMLATVLRGEMAEQQSIFIMRVFREMRHYIKQNHQFVTEAELHLVTSKVLNPLMKILYPIKISKILSYIKVKSLRRM